MPLNPALVESLIQRATLPLVGAGIGGLTGGVFSDEGAGLRGMLQGAMLGGGAGLGGNLLAAIKPADAALMATLMGGGVAGLVGQRRVSPFAVEKMKIREMEKLDKQRKLREAEEQGLEKQQSLKEDVMNIQDLVKSARTALKNKQEKKASKTMTEAEFTEHARAFEHGMDVFMKQAGLSKKAVAQAAKVPVDKLALATMAWVTNETEAK
jgi:uncharacterized membrane protein YhiD involved in acid resistance